MAGASIGQILRSPGIEPADARVLLRAALGFDEARLAAHPEQPLTDEQHRRYRELVERRRAGEPVAYLTGEREFFSLAFKVTPAGLIPRPETELLVETALEHIPLQSECHVLELATGSGCVAVAIARSRSQARVMATDASRAALAVARENAARHRARVEFTQGDLRFEPRAALVAGADGLACIRLIVAQARGHLAPGGRLLLEHGYDQAGRCRALLAEAGFREVTTHRDLAGLERVTAGRI
jgi:release factor glutamine methyltransferase